MDIFMGLFALFGLILFCWCLYEAFVVPHLLKKAKEAQEQQLRLQKDAEELEKRVKEARERGAELVARETKAKPAPVKPKRVKQKQVQPKTRTLLEQDEDDVSVADYVIPMMIVEEAFNADLPAEVARYKPEPSPEPEPVRSARHDDTAWASYASDNYRRDTDSSWSSYSGSSSSDSSYDSGSSSSSSSSSFD